MRKGSRNSLIKEVEAGRGGVGGEWVLVFMDLKGLTRDKEFVLFCMVLKGVGLVRAPLVRQLVDPRKNI